ncbi:MAG TPA: AMP-binding protein [Syntrophorhabdaceae bacterium]|nr:AMP-binding protein [Syntrophorhabdaceae bacterium]
MGDKRSHFRVLVIETLRFVFKCYFTLIHRIVIEGFENVPKSFGKLIIISNHASLLDGLLIWTYIKLPLKIIVDRGVAKKRLFKPFMQNEYTVPIDAMNPYALKEVIDEVNRGTALLIFPEGRMTSTGNLMKIYEGTGFVAYKTGAHILPIYLDNIYSTIFSRKKRGRKIFARLTMTVGRIHEPMNLDGLAPRMKKKAAADTIYQMLCRMRYEKHNRTSLIGREFINLCKRNGGRMAYKDATGVQVSYRKALTGALVLGRYLAGFPDKNIGVLLPNMTATALVFMGLQIFKRVAVFLNYSSGPGALAHAMDLADLKTIVTSRQFLDRVKLAPSVFDGRKLVYMEDLKAKIGLKAKLSGLISGAFPGSHKKMTSGEQKETAVILFTSGSEGVPKGVCLSHENIISNIHQTLSRIDITEDDYFFNALPIFHSFGLTVGTILPLFANAKAYLYVNPLHYRIVPEIVYDEACTILMGTNTFLAGYARKAHPYDFRAMRYIYCGAEALNDAVFENYAKTYGVRVMSGYGATECSPVVAMNSALEYEYGTVGKLLPGMQCKLVPVAGIDSKEGTVGGLFVKGKNVMKGYLKNEKANHKYLVEDECWYETGDIVELTPQGYIKIVGRLKRFSKVSGEMISLTAVEEALAGLYGERRTVVVMPVEDEKKGEKLVLVTNYKDAELKSVRERIRERGLSDLACPREIIYIRDIPKLGTGKVDYVKLKELM